MGDQLVGQRLGSLGGEKAGVRKGDLVELFLDRPDDGRVGMAKTGDRGAA